MQAVILAAGMGKRLGELTKDNTKCMIKVHGVMLIERMLAQLVKLSISRIILVVGYKKEKIMKLVGNSFESVPVVYVENSIYDKTNNIYSLFLAREYLLEEETLLLESDLILSEKILRNVLANPYPNLAVVSKYQSWMDGTVVTLDDDNNILSFVTKKAFDFEDVDFYYKTVNVYKFSKDFSANKYVPFLEAYCKALGHNEYYEQVLRVISLLERPELKACRLDDEKWYEIDDQQDLRNAEVLFSTSDEALAMYNKRYGGYWRFPHLIDFCYLVNPFFPTRRMRDEMKVNFDRLLSEYPSGMSVNAGLAASYMGVNDSQIVAGNGAAELIAAYLREYPLRTGVIQPTFEEYANRLPAGKVIEYIPDNRDYSYSTQDIINYFDKSSPVEQLILINPDNPSGNLLDRRELTTLLVWSKEKGIRLLIDESFGDFACGQDGEISLFENDILTENPHLVLVKSISKSYGVPGLRLGFLASGDASVIAKIKSSVSIWNINSFAEFYMQIFAKYRIDYVESCRLFAAERERFFEQLQTVPYLRVIPSSANYFLCEIAGKFTAKQLVSTLLDKQGFYLKDCSEKKGFDGKQYVRIAIRSKKDNDSLIKALKLING